MSSREDHLELLRQPFTPLVSQGFNEQEMALLNKIGTWLHALMQGTICPISDAQAHFVKVCHGRIRQETEIENLWVRYLNSLKSAKIFERLAAGELLFHEAYPELKDLSFSLSSGCRVAKEWIVSIDKTFSELERTVAGASDNYDFIWRHVNRAAKLGNEIAQMWIAVNSKPCPGGPSTGSSVWDRLCIYHVEHVYNGSGYDSSSPKMGYSGRRI
jgi:uncharacterized protein YifE (UPF0438 family)